MLDPASVCRWACRSYIAAARRAESDIRRQQPHACGEPEPCPLAYHEGPGGDIEPAANIPINLVEGHLSPDGIRYSLLPCESAPERADINEHTAHPSVSVIGKLPPRTSDTSLLRALVISGRDLQTQKLSPFSRCRG